MSAPEKNSLLAIPFNSENKRQEKEKKILHSQKEFHYFTFV